MNTAERLARYCVFDEAVIDAVSAAALHQNSQSFQALADEQGIGAGPQRVHPYADAQNIELFHIKPKTEYDASLLRVYQAPYGVAANKSVAMCALRLFASEPTTQVMVIGSPSALGNSANLLPYRDLSTIRGGDLRQAVRPALFYMQHLGITKAEVLGYSYGGDAGAAMVAAAPDYGIAVNDAVLVESAGVTKRFLPSLIKDFLTSGKHLNAYIASTDCKPLFEARNSNVSRVEKTESLLRWAGGLLRPSNRAIMRGISQGTFSDRLDSALSQQPELRTTLIWGSESEIVGTTAARAMVTTLSGNHPGRVVGLEIKGMHHAGGDDIDLHAAMTLQGLNRVKLAQV